MTKRAPRLLWLLATLAGCSGSDVGDRADPCPLGTEGCACAEAPSCEDDLVCDTTRLICRPAVTCDELECPPHRVCAPPAEGQDAYCDEDCEAGWLWSRRTGTCYPEPPTCEADSELASECEADFRRCVEVDGRASCGPCLDGYVDDPDDSGGVCIEQPVCTDEIVAACAEEGRDCSEGECADCLEDFVAEEDECVPSNCGSDDVPGGIGDACAAVGRECGVVERSTPAGEVEVATCTDCLRNHVEDGSEESCRPLETCESLDCASQNRSCLPGAAGDDAVCGDCRADYEDIGGRCSPLVGAVCDGDDGIADACADEGRSCDPAGPLGARCGDCLEGLVEHPITADCIEPMDCETLNCEADGRQCDPEPTAVCTDCLETMVEDIAGFCREPLTCGDLSCGQLECVEAPEGVVTDARCVTPCSDSQLWNGSACVPCPPCDGPGVVGREARPTLAGWCICETEPGYFYSVANEVGAVPCDADADGWVRESARFVYEAGDPVLIENARCELREIDRITLESESGDVQEVLLATPLPLFESVRNDDDRALREAWAQAELPTDGWGPSGVGMSAALLNPFTKLCDSPRADYNDNGLADAYEYGSAPPAPGFRLDQLPFNTHSYFLELYRGWYEPLGSDPLQGAWHIAERPRAQDAEGAVPLGYQSDGEYWQQCLRRADPNLGQEPPVGLDFADLGLLHHSQFKCVVVRDVPDEEEPLEMTPAEADSLFELNDCEAADEPSADSEANPAEPQIHCTPQETLPQPNTAVWGAVPYTPYQANPAHVGYLGGCVNTCAEAMHRHAADPADLMCPGLPENIPSCVGLEEDFGELECLEVPCDQIDNDEDGEIDEGIPTTCPTGLLGICAVGTPRCEGTAVACDPTPATIESCDGLDNDCDGEVDDETSGVPCAAASPSTGLPAQPGLPGVCGDRYTACIEGVLDCLPGDPYEPLQETLCDGLDNDCDGQVDEDLVGSPVEGQAAGTVFGDDCVNQTENYQGACATTRWQCVNGSAVCAPIAEPEPEGCPEGSLASCLRICDGIDNDCDGETDEDGACLRNWQGTFNLNALLREDDVNMGGSSVTMNVAVEFGGQGTEEATVTFTIEALEQYSRPTEAYIERTKSTTTEGMVASFVGGNRFSLTYIDSDDDRDILKAPGVNPSSNPFELNVQSVSDHDAVVYLYCNGRVPGTTDVVRTFGTYRPDRVGCELVFDVDYTIVPPENPCLGEPEPEICDGIDNDCDGTVDELDYPVPTELVLSFDSDTQFDAGDRLVAILADGTEQELLQGGFLEWVPFLGNLSIPIGVLSVQVPGNTLQLRFEEDGDGDGDQISVGQVRDARNNLLTVPSDLRPLSGGETSARVDYFDALGLGQVCGSDVGACSPGTLACQDGAVICAGGIEPVSESDVCDGIDDNCDGEADELVRESCTTSCGPGTRSCESGAECLSAWACQEQCGVQGYRHCAAGAVVYGACEWDHPDEICDGIDNNCDGDVDEGFDVGETCTRGHGACRVSGVWACTADGARACSAGTPPQGTQEVCDGIDNDCDELIDEDAADTEFGLRVNCYVDEDGDGYAASTTGMERLCACGSQQTELEPTGLSDTDCDDTAGGADINPAASEVCDDNVDNDCDGDVDAADADCPP